MITVEEVLILHDLSISFFGGRVGVRDIEMLKSAVSRPFQTFDNRDVYNTVFEKAAALLESIVKNHPFADGNKRTGFLSAVIYLKRNNMQLIASEEEAGDFVISVAASQVQFMEVVNWFKRYTVSF